MHNDRSGDPYHQASPVSDFYLRNPSRMPRRAVEDSLTEHLESKTPRGRNTYEFDPSVVDRDVVASMQIKIESCHGV